MTIKHVVGPALSEQELSSIVAQRLRSLPDLQGALADRAGVDPRALRAIARGEKAASIDVLWKIANALDVPFGALIARARHGGVVVVRHGDANLLEASDGAFKSRALTAFGADPRVEIYQLTIAEGHVEQSQAHSPGTSENIVVAQGAIEVVVGREPPYRLDQGDGIHFDADVPHSYRNLGKGEAIAHLVMSYRDRAD